MKIGCDMLFKHALWACKMVLKIAREAEVTLRKKSRLRKKSNLIKPKPRNAIDSELPEWKAGNAPYYWVPNIGNDGTPCACRNGTDVCAPAQTCLWFSVGCTIGCKECDGGDRGSSNPNKKDRCGGGMKATNNDPMHRTLNRAAEAGSDADWTKFNPWRAPGGLSVRLTI